MLLLRESTLSFFKFSVFAAGRGILMQIGPSNIYNDLESFVDCGECI